MINGVNTVDFTFAKDSKTTISTALPQARSELITVFQYAYAKPEITMSTRNLTKADEMEPPGLERVHVQRLQTHTQLRNNKWTYQNFYSNAASTAAIDNVIDASYKIQYNHNNNNNNNSSKNNNNNNNINTTNNNINNNNNNTNKNIIENKSALFKCNNDEQLRQPQQLKQQQQQMQQLNFDVAKQLANVKVVEHKQNFSDTFMITGDGEKIITLDSDNGNSRPNYYRTKDQENAFRRIEDVHNYAKLKRYGNSNESSDGSTHGFDDDDDEDEDDDDDVEGDDDNDDNGVVAGEPTGLPNYQTQMPKSLANAGNAHVVSVGAGYLQPKTLLAKNYVRTPSKSSSIEDTDAIVDVETVASENSEQQLMQSPPAHHARRPMNAFLIFCKRHRAIVKDRYKSLENRAITKILGDWWAALDGDEKECFTKLAQQNKDAFFSAHPNFKWYKLPAPPLRTLSTRPSNAERAVEDNELEQTDEQPKNVAKNQAESGFFKLADETQMGELNTLMNERNKNECPLQKALGETTHFLSAHMPSTIESGEINAELNENRNNKKRAIAECGFSSNSSEDDLLPKKSSRSCKGKIYQKLVSSGQIAPIAKKTRLTKATNVVAANFGSEQQGADYNYAVMQANANSHEGFNASSYLHAMDIRGNKVNRTVSESDANQSHPFGEHIGQFDLEEKIKQLPALSLDAYLQRKRNTKKKKKFTTRKRTSSSVSLPITDHHCTLSMAAEPKSETRNYVQQQQQQQQAVGSQKRKARKESITRRDVSAIESEVASLMPLASNYELPNGHFYYDENPNATNAIGPTAAATNSQIVNSMPATTSNASNVNAANFGDLSRAYSNYADSITTTSDLFILAEVAAKRTELTNSN